MSEGHRRFSNAPDPASPLDIAPVAGRIGAEVRGLALSRDLDDEAIAAVKAALVRHKVLFFRDQALDDVAQEQFAARMGTPRPHPTMPLAGGSRYMLELDSFNGYHADIWHTDLTFAPAYPAASILRAIEIPPAGGDTMWANTATAYGDLPAPLKQAVAALRAIHCNAIDFAQAVSRDRPVYAATLYETDHPVVAVHPVSGEPTLLAGWFLKRFVGLDPADLQRLLATLQDHITRPENVVRWRWREGDVAIWDNRATQHRAVIDFMPMRRRLRRVTLEGGVAVGTDGRESFALQPPPEAVAAAAE